MKKKNVFLIYKLLIVGIFILFASSCKKDIGIPVMSTTVVTDITQTTAKSGGNITSDGGATVTARGVCWSISQTPTIADYKTTDGTGTSSFTSAITGLTANTTYYVRAYATNSAGTAYGSALSFITQQGGSSAMPVLSTSVVTDITQTTVKSGGNITSDGGATVTARGVCWSTSQTPTIADNKTTDGTGTGSFTSAITGLTANTTYYVRAYATNSAGTAYGSARSFITLKGNNDTIIFNPTITYGSMTDIEGNTYKTVTIGTQTWMAENLKVTKYNDGTNIPNVTDDYAWYQLTTESYCNYDNDPSKVATYGRLYNWYTINTEKVCPVGWHVPTNTEWTTLTDYLGGKTIAGGKLKEIGTTHWHNPNEGATNESGFTALPCGQRDANGMFFFVGDYGSWWSATENSATEAWSRYTSNNYSDVGESHYVSKKTGYSVRCVKD